MRNNSSGLIISKRANISAHMEVSVQILDSIKQRKEVAHKMYAQPPFICNSTSHMNDIVKNAVITRFMLKTVEVWFIMCYNIV